MHLISTLKKFFVFSVTFILVSARADAQNMITNPSAETGNSSGWTIASTGTACYTGSNWVMPHNQNGYPVAQHGAFFFNPGCGGSTGANYELYQDVNISAQSTQVDAGNYSVTFSGYLRSYNQSPADPAAFMVEYRNTGGTVLQQYSTGATTHLMSWVQYSNTRIAPVGTRTVRIRLIGTSANGGAVDSYFDDISLTASLLLPVKLTSFKAIKSVNGTMLSWETANEISNKGFRVNKSTNGTSWTTVGFVPASKTASSASGSGNYKFTDFSLQEETAFYQLVQEDLDGKLTHSEIKVVTGAAGKHATIFPNPVANELNIVTSLNHPKVEISDVNGRVIKIFNGMLKLNVSALSPGVYTATVSGNGLRDVLKFVKH